ncbi:hypothetical protein BU23DRAFT_553830 [Bimuria novae-zelandiae CBS 107.79]|uniref:Uncharacterized protein n=1 Tax=Bimuria novae-zelandiae CBS 107.79 TaxID=1447943 RepID=A0A6A5VAY0_9PLEO|nr:hypothetical protein BU23DRAFT_553830 [Bimuria novae-zelandiae CBS 107.79]
MPLPTESIVGILALFIALPPTVWALYHFHQVRRRRRQPVTIDILPIHATDQHHPRTLSFQFNVAMFGRDPPL